MADKQIATDETQRVAELLQVIRNSKVGVAPGPWVVALSRELALIIVYSSVDNDWEEGLKIVQAMLDDTVRNMAAAK